MMDMHCHIDLYDNHHKVIENCKREKLYILSVTTTPSAWDGTYNLTAKIPRFNTALGLHPQLAKERENELHLFDKLIHKTRYIGEIGLDGSPNNRLFFDAQLRVFRHILSTCQQYQNKILTIHSRGAVKEVINELSYYKNAGIPIFHWYLGSKKDMERALSLGAWFSIGPAMLKSKHGCKVINWLPKDRVLLETDGPFTEYLGKTLEPKDYPIMIKHLSTIWFMSEIEIKNQLLNNLKTLCQT